MTTPAHRSPSESIVKSQPVIVHAVAAWLVSALLFAAVHFKIVVPGLTPAATAYLIPVVTAVVGSAFTFSLWHFVAPAWKLAQAELKLAGVTIPDFGPPPASVPLSPAQPAVERAVPGATATPFIFPPGDAGQLVIPGSTPQGAPLTFPTGIAGQITTVDPSKILTFNAPIDYVAQAAALQATA